MKNIKIKIAGIVFNINTDYEFGLTEIDKTYYPFLTAQKPKISIDLIYHKKLPFSLLHKAELIFDSQSYWQLYRFKEKKVIVWRTPGKNPLITHIGIFNDNFSIGKVYLRYRYRHLDKSPRYRHKIRISKKPHELFYQNILGVIMLNLPFEDRVMFHSAGVKDKKNGYLFPGYSGDGKSTMSNLWRKSNATILSDEYIILKKNKNIFSIYGTPWCGTNSQDYSSESTQLSKVYILNKGVNNKENILNKSVAVSYLMARCKLPIWSKEETEKRVKLCHDLVNKGICYRLDFLPTQSIVEYIRKSNQ